MANCIYCGQPAGILHTKHADCQARAQEVLGRFRQQVEDYVRRGASAPALQTDGLTIPHERYQGVVSAVSYSRTGDRALSEDIAQDTFIAAWRQLGQLREPSRLRSWLCGIARNLARKARRRTAREAPLEGVTGKLVVEALSDRGVLAAWMPSLEQGVAYLARRAEPGDVLLVIGAGDVDRAPALLRERLR